MSKLNLLRDAVEKLDQAEEAMFHAREAYHQTDEEYGRMDSCYENVGDLKSLVEYILHKEESIALLAAHLEPVLKEELEKERMMKRNICYQHGQWTRIVGDITVDESNVTHSHTADGEIIPEAGDIVVTGNSADNWKDRLPPDAKPGELPEHYTGNNYWELVSAKE